MTTQKQYIQKDQGKHDTAYVMFNEAPVNAGGEPEELIYLYNWGQNPPQTTRQKKCYINY